MYRAALISQLFAECKPDSSSSLCVDRPSEIYDVIWTVGTALVIKGCLTIVTFGIKLPGMYDEPDRHIWPWLALTPS
jgi:hypothetical protein